MRKQLKRVCYLAYLFRADVSPRLMSANIALDLAASHKTAEPTDVDAPVLDTGTVNVRPSPLEILCMA